MLKNTYNFSKSEIASSESLGLFYWILVFIYLSQLLLKVKPVQKWTGFFICRSKMKLTLLAIILSVVGTASGATATWNSDCSDCTFTLYELPARTVILSGVVGNSATFTPSGQYADQKQLVVRATKNGIESEDSNVAVYHIPIPAPTDAQVAQGVTININIGK